MKREYMLHMASSVVLAAAFQMVLAQYVRIGTAKPDLVGVVAISYGLLCGPEAGLVCGLAGGLVLDLASSRLIGLMGVTRAAVGVAAGLAGTKVFKENLLMTGAVGFVFTFCADMLGALIITLRGPRFGLRPAIEVALSGGLFSLILAPFVFYMLWRIKVRIDSRQSPVILE